MDAHESFSPNEARIAAMTQSAPPSNPKLPMGLSKSNSDRLADFYLAQLQEIREPITLVPPPLDTRQPALAAAPSPPPAPPAPESKAIDELRLAFQSVTDVVGKLQAKVTLLADELTAYRESPPAKTQELQPAPLPSVPPSPGAPPVPTPEMVVQPTPVEQERGRRTHGQDASRAVAMEGLTAAMVAASKALNGKIAKEDITAAIQPITGMAAAMVKSMESATGADYGSLVAVSGPGKARSVDGRTV